MPAERLHPQRRDAAPAKFRQHLFCKALKMRVKRVQRHLHGVKRKSGFKHLQMNRGIFVPGKSQESHLAFLLGLEQSLSRSVGPNEQFRIVVPANAMHLPQIQMIGLQPIQRLLEHPRRDHRLAAVGADLGHQKHFVPAAFQPFSHPVFGLPAVVFPAVVKERYPAIDRFLHDADRRPLVGGIAQVVSTKSQGRDILIMAPKRPHRYAVTPRSSPSGHQFLRIPTFTRHGTSALCRRDPWYSRRVASVRWRRPPKVLRPAHPACRRLSLASIMSRIYNE